MFHRFRVVLNSVWRFSFCAKILCATFALCGANSSRRSHHLLACQPCAYYDFVCRSARGCVACAPRRRHIKCECRFRATASELDVFPFVLEPPGHRSLSHAIWLTRRYGRRLAYILYFRGDGIAFTRNEKTRILMSAKRRPRQHLYSITKRGQLWHLTSHTRSPCGGSLALF